MRVGAPIPGGQGRSFVAQPKDGSGPRVFIKTLRLDRRTDRQARGRFNREVETYDTLADVGLPQLLDHNAKTWKDGRTPMYMVTELIDGGNLQTYVTEVGRADIGDALACVRELASVLSRCHEREVSHRDVKPANVVLRNGRITEPVLIDFGLSFNRTAENDPLTRVGEEVGNRFLRLPEHSIGGRSAVSDVTQLAGLFLYTVTGCEPRTLRDASDRMPHQRPEARAVLDDSLPQRQLLRLLSVLDTAFATDLLARYATATEFVTALESVMHADETGEGNLEDLLAQVDEVVSQGISASGERRDSLTRILTAISTVAGNFAAGRGLGTSTQGGTPEQTNGDQWQERRIAVVVPGEDPSCWPVYRVERRGAQEYVVAVDGKEIWRGESADDSLTRATQIEIAQQFLAAHANRASADETDAEEG